MTRVTIEIEQSRLTKRRFTELIVRFLHAVVPCWYSEKNSICKLDDAMDMGQLPKPSSTYIFNVFHEKRNFGNGIRPSAFAIADPSIKTVMSILNFWPMIMLWFFK